MDEYKGYSLPSSLFNKKMNKTSQLFKKGCTTFSTREEENVLFPLDNLLVCTFNLCENSFLSF